MTDLTSNQEKAINDIEVMFADIIDDMMELPDSTGKRMCIARLKDAQFWATQCVIEEVK